MDDLVPQQLNIDVTIPLLSCVREGALHVKKLKDLGETGVFRSSKCLPYIPNLKRDQGL